MRGFSFGEIMKSKKVYGVGINDADYKTQTFSDGAVISCKYYKTWKDMLMRCYSENTKRSTQPITDALFVMSGLYLATLNRGWLYSNGLGSS